MKLKAKKRLRLLGKILFILYILFLIYFLVFSDWYGRVGQRVDYQYNLQLFKEISNYWEHREILGWIAYSNLFGNVLIFIPFGFFMPMASKYRSLILTTLYSFGLSFVVEAFQLVTKVGSFDVDDLLLNTIGGIVGYIIFLICNTIRRWHDVDRKRKRSGERKRTR